MSASSHLSRERILIPVRANSPRARALDLAGDVAGSVAFLSGDGDPVDGDFDAAEWQTDTSVTPARHFLSIMVGPGSDVVLSEGRYRVVVKLVGDGEEIVDEVGYHDVT